MKIFVFCFLALFCSNSSAWAARAGTVNADDTPMYDSPATTGTTLAKLKKDEAIVSSNSDSSGFYKVRNSSGVVGWVAEAQLTLQPPPSPDEVKKEVDKLNLPPPSQDGSSPPLPSAPAPVASINNPSSSSSASSSSYLSIGIRGLAGFNFYSAGSVINNYALANGVSFGGELLIRAASFFAFVFRFEKIGQVVNLTDTASGDSLQVTLSSYPAMAGIEIELVQTKGFILGIAALGGLGISTGVNIADNTVTSNSASFTLFPLTAIGKIMMHWRVADFLSFFIEGGYRYLDTGPVSNVVGISSIMQSSVDLSLSGIFSGGGITINF